VGDFDREQHVREAQVAPKYPLLEFAALGA
jgi:hypothetical protein